MPTRDYPNRSDISHVVNRGFSTRVKISLGMTFSPSAPTWPSTTPNGTIVATLRGGWFYGSLHPTGQPYLGDYVFVAPSFDSGGVYDIVLNSDHSGSLRIAPSGPGVSGAGGTTQHVTVAPRQ